MHPDLVIGLVGEPSPDVAMHLVAFAPGNSLQLDDRIPQTPGRVRGIDRRI
jgi:hypothetical protein